MSNNLLKAINILETAYPKQAGYFYACLGQLFSLGMWIAVKEIQGFSTFQIIFWRSILLVIPNHFIIRKVEGKHYTTDVKTNRLLIIRGFSGGTTILLMFYGLRLLPLSEATILSMMSPIFSGIFAALIVGESYNIGNLVSALLCFAGVFFIVQPDFVFHQQASNTEGQSDHFLGVTLCSISAVTAGLNTVFFRKLGALTSTVVVTQYFGVCATIIGGFMIVVTGFAGQIKSEMMIYMVLLAICGNFNQFMLTRSYKFGKTASIALIGYSKTILSLIYDFAHGIYPDMLSSIGMVLITLTLLINVYINIRQGKKVEV